MKNIDFLPAKYREEHNQRRASVQRLAVAVMVAALIGAAAWTQHTTRRRVMAELESVQLMHKHTSTQHSELNHLEGELEANRATARLLTYLRHPWPRTQLLSLLLDPLPPTLTLERVRIVSEQRDNVAARKPLTARPSAGVAAPAETKIAPLADLERLQEDRESRETFIWLTGVTTDNAALHAYLIKLGQYRLLTNPQLKSVESLSGDDGRIRFVARLKVARPYGLPGHPTAESLTEVAASASRGGTP